VHESLDAIDRALPFERTWLFTTRATATHTDATYPDGAVLVFGRESSGLPQDWLDRRRDHHVRIPMKDTIRSLNLANSVAVAVYEARRQQNWKGM
jgi:tRNA (cytidine/uridine-2'-O-)-methyltransferase